MAKLPEPPETLPAAEEYVATGLLWRISFAAGPYPTTWSTFRRWGPTDARFDPHDPPPRLQDTPVLYAASDARACFAEVFQVARLVDRRTHVPILAAFEPTRPLRLLDLTGAWPTRAGASMALSTGAHARARRWALAVHRAFPELDGLWYPSSMYKNLPCAALWGAAERAMPSRPRFHRRLDAPELRAVVANVCLELGYRMG